MTQTRPITRFHFPLALAALACVVLSLAVLCSEHSSTTMIPDAEVPSLEAVPSAPDYLTIWMEPDVLPVQDPLIRVQIENTGSQPLSYQWMAQVHIRKNGKWHSLTRADPNAPRTIAVTNTSSRLQPGESGYASVVLPYISDDHVDTWPAGHYRVVVTIVDHNNNITDCAWVEFDMVS